MYDESWGLTSLAVQLGERAEQVSPRHELLLLLSDDAADLDLTLSVTGQRGDVRYAPGQLPVRVRLHKETRVALTLERLPCGSGCTPGETGCEGDGLKLCGDDDEDGCPAWGPTVPCATGTSCSLGECSAGCVDECAIGEMQCLGPLGVRACGTNDSDPCTDWLPADACPSGQSCSAGRCGATCSDECTQRDGGTLPATDGGTEGSGCGVLRARIRDFVGEMHPDFQTFKGTTATQGMVEDRLDRSHLPVLKATHGQVSSQTTFDQWYRDVPGVNLPLPSTSRT